MLHLASRRYLSRVSIQVPDVFDGVRFYQGALNLKLASSGTPGVRALLGPKDGCQLELLRLSEGEPACASLSPVLTYAVSNLSTAVRSMQRKGGSGKWWE